MTTTPEAIEALIATLADLETQIGTDLDGIALDACVNFELAEIDDGSSRCIASLPLPYFRRLLAASELIRTLQPRIDQLEGALKPFIPHKATDFITDDTGVILQISFDGATYNFPAFKWGDLRNARQILGEASGT